MAELEGVSDLVEFAQSLQLDAIEQPFDRRMAYITSALEMLGICAQELYEDGAEYWINSRQSFWSPDDRLSKRRTMIRFDSLDMAGNFVDFSYLSIGAIHNRAINSLCMDLTGVRLLPDGDRLPPDQVVRIPVLSVEYALRVA